MAQNVLYYPDCHTAIFVEHIHATSTSMPARYLPDLLPQEAQPAHTGDDAILRSAIDICFRSHETIQGKSGAIVPEYAGLASRPQRVAGRNLVSKLIRPKEEAALLAWAKANKKLLSNKVFMRNWQLMGSVEGAEHALYYDERVGRWYKRNDLSYHSSYLDYFYRVALHNRLFPEAPIKLEGFVWDDTRPEGQRIMPIVSQLHVRANDPQAPGADRQTVEQHMLEIGFVRRPDSDDYYNATTGITVEDLHNENVLIGEGGMLYVIDPVIYMDESGKTARLAAHQALQTLRSVKPSDAPRITRGLEVASRMASA